jgi:hypothetical protein
LNYIKVMKRIGMERKGVEKGVGSELKLSDLELF